MSGWALATNLEAFASAVVLIMSAMIEVLLSPIQFTETLKRWRHFPRQYPLDCVDFCR